jgi:hypothetical protein
MWVSPLTMASATADSCPAQGNNNTRGITSTPSTSSVSQQRCKAQFVPAKTDRDSSRISPIIIPAPDALPSPNSGQRTGHHNAVVSYLGRLQIETTIIQGGECTSAPISSTSRHIRVITPTSETFVSFPPQMEGRDAINQGSFIPDEALDCYHYGFSRGTSLFMPSAPILRIISPEGEPEIKIIDTHSNSPALNRAIPDASSQQCSDFDQHQIPSRKVCLWMIHLHNKLEWIVNLVMAVIHVTQQTYCEMNQSMCRLFLYFLFTHWVEELIKWVLAWRMVPLQLHNNSQHKVGDCFVTLKIQRGSVSSNLCPSDSFVFRLRLALILEQLLKALP